MRIRTKRTPPRTAGHRYVTSFDMRRLHSLVYSRLLSHRGELPTLDRLKDGLDRAIVVPPQGISPQVVTMYSRVRVLDLDSRRHETYTLVFPAEANIAENRISVLTPVGSALLGRRAGDLVSCIVPSGRRDVKVIDVVYQPEAAGEYLR